MRRHCIPAALGAAVLGIGTIVAATPASAAVEKATFNDVTLPNGQIGEIEANTKSTNKADSVYCGYFTDDYQESLGYYFAHVESAPPVDQLLDFCLAHFDDRFT